MSIVIENLSKSYGPVRALQNVSCTWEPGKLYGLLGRKLGHSWSVPIHAALGSACYPTGAASPWTASPSGTTTGPSPRCT